MTGSDERLTGGALRAALANEIGATLSTPGAPSSSGFSATLCSEHSRRR
jgi:hypothetical protein